LGEFSGKQGHSDAPVTLPAETKWGRLVQARIPKSTAAALPRFIIPGNLLALFWKNAPHRHH
jgi:hypothetical protein